MNNKKAELPVINVYDKENKFLLNGIRPSSLEKLHKIPPVRPYISKKYIYITI
jgi:hypothetical protein